VNVPKTYRTADGINLWIWIDGQRRALRKGKLSPEREASLMALGVVVNNPKERKWEKTFAVVAALVKAKGHTNIPARYRTPEGLHPYEWMCDQRRAFRNGRLSDERIARLTAAGIPLTVGDGQRLPTTPG
jgi:hypothetical protein